MFKTIQAVYKQGILKPLGSIEGIKEDAEVKIIISTEIKNSPRIKENTIIFNEFIDFCNILNITKETADHYSAMRLDLKRERLSYP